MEPAVPHTSVHSYVEHGMRFKVTSTRCAESVEKWIIHVKERFLNAAPIKCVGLDCEFTPSKKGVRQKILPPEQKQRAAILQLSVAYEILVFQIVHADAVPEALKEFLGDTSIRFCGAAIGNDERMLKYYEIAIPGAWDLQLLPLNPAIQDRPSLVALSNAILGTNLPMKQKNTTEHEKWASLTLTLEQIRYAALDARLGFEIARKFWELDGYNSQGEDHLNV